ncbi:hypothetical protein ATI53_101755 [Salipiger aestuarii]|uniref:Uncharacterized protein n=1 Tax=Salipiger aestuarii TaxID=568098 RepID=A0A327Y746_9RHOB|nr:hypothetical protein ATI53_101755 [Salipiger aestuarii]
MSRRKASRRASIRICKIMRGLVRPGPQRRHRMSAPGARAHLLRRLSAPGWRAGMQYFIGILVRRIIQAPRAMPSPPIRTACCRRNPPGVGRVASIVHDQGHGMSSRGEGINAPMRRRKSDRDHPKLGDGHCSRGGGYVDPVGNPRNPWGRAHAGRPCSARNKGQDRNGDRPVARLRRGERSVVGQDFQAPATRRAGDPHSGKIGRGGGQGWPCTADGRPCLW